MRSLFIADAHLERESDPAYRAMLRFLAESRGTTGTLYILGDFFEFWIGYPTVPFTHYLPVLEALRQLADSGTAIVFFEGNHDFHMGPFFTDTLRARVFPGPAAMTLDGRRAYLCHGDQVNAKDIPSRLLRGILHSPLTRWLTHVVPPGVAGTIAERMGRSGRQNLHYKGENPACRTILRDFAAQRFADGYELVITGHFHLPFTEPAPDGSGKLLVSLGDWATRLSYAEMVDGEITLQTFR
ncbi:MAG: UDP-2,3-diacylglucosamine diphosphatase [Geobacter sp.]|nr:UDP-2,3-diacylglucosamine diphosphatase [Geobacter sp.]